MADELPLSRKYKTLALGAYPDVGLAGARAQARETLAHMARVTGRRKGLVFPSPQDISKPLSKNTLNKALASLGYKGRHTSHGFRSSASTILNERGYREAVIEIQLNHLEPDETRRAYNRARFWDERVALMEDWAGIVDSLRQSPAEIPQERNARLAEARESLAGQ